MSNRNIPNTLNLTLPKQLTFMEDLPHKYLDEADRLKYESDMVIHHIGMLETELREAQQTLSAIDALRGEKARVEVILNVFSGYPNPRWVLSEREVKELRKLLDLGLRTPLKKPKELPGLGYSGFVIHNEAGIMGIPEKMDVYRRIITIVETMRGRGKRTYYEDVNRIELWLVEQAVDRGYGDTIEHFGGPSMK